MLYKKTWLEKVIFLKRKGGGGGTPAHEATSYTGSFFTDMVAPLKKLLVSFMPKQDLHGYDKPWAGGSGKNCLDIDALFVAPQGTLYSGDTPYTFPHVLELALTPNTTYTVSSDYTIANKQRIVYVDTATAADAVYKANSVVKTTGSDGVLKIGFFDNRTGSEDFLNKTVYLQVEEGSTATAYAPYENVCPISGHTECVTYDDPMYGGLIEFNQLVQNGDFSNGTSHWTNNFSTASVSDGVCELTLQAANGYLYQSVPQKVEGHKIYFVADASATASVNLGVLWGASMQSRIMLSATEQRVNFIATVGSGNTNLNLSFGGTSGSKIYLSNVQLFDLTMMFGAGNEPTTVDEFKALFPHDYYEYNEGETTCVSAVNGDEYHQYVTSLSKNIWNKNVKNGDVIIDGLVPGQRYTASAKMVNASTPTYCYVRRKLKTESEYTNVNEIIKNKTVKPVSFTVNGNYDYSIWCNAAYGNVTDVQIELGSTATEYEPYGTPVYSSTVDLISGEAVVDKGFAVFDGTETWTKNTRALNAFYTARPQGCKQGTTMLSDKFAYVDNVQMLYNTYGACFCGSSMNFNVDPTTIGGDTIEDWKAWLANNPLQVVYELATPQTYQLTPQQINSLNGQNNFITEDGAEVSEIVYLTHLVGGSLLGGSMSSPNSEDESEEPVEEIEESGE